MQTFISLSEAEEEESPAMVTEKLDFKSAAKRSWTLNDFKSRMKLVVSLVSYIVLLMLVGIAVAMLIGVIMLFVVWWLEPGLDPGVVLNDTTLSAVMLILFMVFGWFVQPTVCSVCASRYYRKILAEGFEPEPYNIENRHILQRRTPQKPVIPSLISQCLKQTSHTAIRYSSCCLLPH